MIDDSKTAKALLDKAQAFADSKGLRLCVDGLKFEPETSETYLKEMFLQNETDPLGLAADSSDRQDSIYQLSVYTPKGDGKFANLALVNDIKAEFIRATFLVNDSSQKVQIESVSASPLLPTDTHNVTAISINLVVLATNT